VPCGAERRMEDRQAEAGLAPAAVAV
jgi:hypothetical protein